MGEGSEEPVPPGGDPAGALARFLPVLTAGMRPEEAGRAGEISRALFALRSAGRTPAEVEEEIRGRRRKAEGLSLDERRRMVEEDRLALAVGKESGRISGNALRVLTGDAVVTKELKKETRRAVARLGQVNAVLVGRFPHRTDLLGQVSEAYLDAMFILNEGKGPASTRLMKIRKDRESPEAKG